MAAPGRVVLWPVVAGLSRRRRPRGWDHTSTRPPGVECLPRWEGSSCSLWPRRRRDRSRGQGFSPVGSRVVEERCGIRCGRWRGSRASCRHPKAMTTWGGLPGWCACRRDEANLSSTSGHSRLCLGLSCRLDEAVTPTTRAAPPDLGHDPTVTRLRIWRLGVRIPRGAPNTQVRSYKAREAHRAESGSVSP